MGDRYVEMENGPVPSEAYNLVKHDERARPENQALFDALIAVQGNDLKVVSRPNLAYLSQTDLEILDNVVREYGLLSASQLSKLSHRDTAWMKAEMNSDMDLCWIFTEDPDAEQMKNIAQEDQELRDSLATASIEG